MSALATPRRTDSSLEVHSDAPASPVPILRAAIGADELADLVRSFTEITERLQTTHVALSAQVGQLQAELAEATEQLRRSRELAALGEMAAGIAHEIRNPLGSIALDVEVLREEADGRPEERRICERVLRAVERLDQIVGDVLRFARDLRPQSTAVEPGAVVEQALALCDACIRRGGVQVERLALVEGEVGLDHHLVAQALANLMRNAVEAMVESGAGPRVLRVGARRARRTLPDGRRTDHLIFRVEDSGPGVPEELIERIFHPFFTTRNDGTGLGLAIVHRIVDAHGGSIAVRNQPTGGARFEIAIPLRRDEHAPSRERGDGVDAAVRRRLGGMHASRRPATPAAQAAGHRAD